MTIVSVTSMLLISQVAFSTKNKLQKTFIASAVSEAHSTIYSVSHIYIV